VSGTLLIAIKVLLVCGIAFGWGFNELRQLKKYKKTLADDKAPSEKGEGS
jgi:hypothetical protein